MSPSENSVLDQIDPLREEDSDLFAAATPRKRSPGSATSSAAASTPVSVTTSAAPVAADRDAAAAAAPAAAVPSVQPATGAADAVAARSESAGTPGAPCLKLSHSLLIQNCTDHSLHLISAFCVALRSLSVFGLRCSVILVSSSCPHQAQLSAQYHCSQ